MDFTLVIYEFLVAHALAPLNRNYYFYHNEALPCSGERMP